MTVGKVADALLDMHVIEQAKETRTSAGRRAGMLSIAPENYAVILDLTSRNFSMTIVNVRLEVMEKYHYAYNEDFYFEENLTLYMKEVGLFLKRNMKPEHCIGFGVSVPGPYYPAADRTVSTRIPELNSIPIAQTVRANLSPSALYIEAGYNAAATSNIARIPNHSDMVILYWFVGENNNCGTIVYHGQIIRGAHNTAGNFGRMISSGGKTLEAALKSANTPEENAYELARAIHNVVMAVDPDCIILECELYKNSDDFVGLVRNTLSGSFDMSPESIPELVSAGCKFRHSHRGLTLALREMWLSKLIFGDGE